MNYLIGYTKFIIGSVIYMNLNKEFKNIEEHLLNDDKPSKYLNIMKENGEFNNEPFNWIASLEGMEQSPKHHPEGNVWIHTMMVVDKGIEYRDKVNDRRAFMWALLLHDLGKRSTTKLRKGRWTSYDHDKVGQMDSKEFLNHFNLDEKFINKVTTLVRYHMHLLFITNNMPYGDIKGMERDADLHDLSYVFLSDRLGRGGLSEDDARKVELEVENFRKKYKL